MDKPRLYTRADLELLKTFSRQETFERALRSFDHAGLDDDALALRTCALADPARVPGLQAAITGGDAGAARQALYDAACASAQAAANMGKAGDGQEPGTEPRLSDEARKLADDAMAHRFTFYGETHQLPDDIDWDHNPGTAHWGMDLNRFTYLGPLTSACLVTGDTRYGRKAVGLMLDWIAKAPYERMFKPTDGLPPGTRVYMFGSYLNQALHLQAWTASLVKLLPLGLVTPAQWVMIFKSLHDQVAYLQVLTAGHAGNWPTIGARGMLPTVARFPMLRDRELFVGHCIDLLDVQVAEQVLPDGVQDELTPHYHDVVISNLFECIESLNRLGRALTPRTLETLRGMLHYRQQTITPGGKTMVAFNDSDPYAVGNNDRRAVALGFGDALLAPDQLGPELFPYAGVAFLRQRASEGDLYLAFDAGPYGRAHQHEDKLGFWLHAYGRDFLVDPGRHLYDHSEKSFRSHMVSTRAHSTILVDGQGQCASAHRATWIARVPEPILWSVAPGMVRAGGRYALGYGPGAAIPAAHAREIAFVADRFWVVFDRVTLGAEQGAAQGAAQGAERQVESRFQYGPGDVRAEADGALARCVTCFSDANLLLLALADGPWESVDVAKGRMDPRDGWYSHGYGQIEPAPSLALRGATRGGAWSCVTLLWPYKGTGTPDAGLQVVGDTLKVRADGQAWDVALPTSA